MAATTAGAAVPGGFTEQAAKAALERAEQALNAPETLSTAPAAGSRDATAALRDLAVALPALSGADRAQARDLLARPTDKRDRDYFGKEAAASPTCDEDFCVHWTDKTANRPAENVFDEIMPAVTHSRTVENTDLGWKNPKPDGMRGARHGKGRDGQVDVYVTNLGRNLYGYASTDPGQKGRKRFAYLVLDNDYVGFPTGPVKSMQVTVAHEYNHILQFNYDVAEDLWLFEDTATWAEEQVYPLINDYLNYLPALAGKPEKPMTGSSIKIYAEAVWNHWLSGIYGKDVVRRTWQVSPKQRSFAVDSYDKAIKKAGGSGFARELGDFFAATAEWRSLPIFPDNEVYPDVKRTAGLGGKSKRAKLDNTAYRLYDVDPSADPSVTLKVKADKGTRSSISLIGRQGGATSGTVTLATKYLGKGGSGRVTLPNPGSFSRITAMIANVDGRSNRKTRRGKRIYKSDGSTYRFHLVG